VGRRIFTFKLIKRALIHPDRHLLLLHQLTQATVGMLGVGMVAIPQISG
jgi:hypothetical protein